MAGHAGSKDDALHERTTPYPFPIRQAAKQWLLSGPRVAFHQQRAGWPPTPQGYGGNRSALTTLHATERFPSAAAPVPARVPPVAIDDLSLRVFAGIVGPVLHRLDCFVYRPKSSHNNY